MTPVIGSSSFNVVSPGLVLPHSTSPCQGAARRARMIEGRESGSKLIGRRRGLASARRYGTENGLEGPGSRFIAAMTGSGLAQGK